MSTRTLRGTTGLLALSLFATGCGSPPSNPLDIGIRQVALSLAFSEEDLVDAVDPEVIIQLIPTPADVRGPQDLTRFESPARTTVTPPPPAPTPACPAAGPGAAAEVPVSLNVASPPRAGRYARHNSGTLTVTGGANPLVLPYPAATTWDIGEPVAQQQPPVVGGGEPTATTRYEITKSIAPNYVVVDLLQVDPDAIVLVRRTTITDAGESVFEPNPGLDIYRFGSEATRWTVAGVDTTTGTAMSIDAVIDGREVVDACGTLIDTYRVSASEQVVNLRTGDTSGTPSGEPNIYNVATQYGGLIVREDVHVTAVTTTAAGTVRLEFDYLSTIDSIVPEYLP